MLTYHVVFYSSTHQNKAILLHATHTMYHGNSNNNINVSNNSNVEAL